MIEPTNKLCDGICGLVSLSSSNYSTPYAGLYFNTDNVKKAGTDISSWGGICLTYVIPETTTILELIFEEPQIAPYVASLDTKEGSANIPWSDFKPLGEEGKELLGQEIFLTAVKSIRITWKGNSSFSSSFVINSVGKYGSCK